MEIQSITLLPWGLLLLCTVAGCSLYNRSYPVAAAPAKPEYDLHIVQVDDFGSLWQLDAAQAALAAVDEQRRLTNTLVVVFIHGWHHSAKSDDPNLRDFKDALSKIAKLLNSGGRRTLRQNLASGPESRLIGIYVGWRGRSLPGFLDYATAWWRKAAAERVGSGDVSEFLERLQRIYLRANALDRNNPAPSYRRMGLVTVGHSFGGQVLLQSIGRYLEYSLAERAPCMSDAVTQPADSARATEEVPIDSFGDLNILLNPATEAYQFRRIDGLYRQLTYPTQQTPQLVIFSADNDKARKIFFPAARFVTRPFRPGFRTSYQGALWGKALGELKDQQTHDLNVMPGGDSLTETDYGNGGQKIAEYDFTAATIFSGIKLIPKKDRPQYPNSPVAVVYTHDKIIDGHNGIFRDGFRTFLARYISFVEAKRLIVKHQQRVNPPTHQDRHVSRPNDCR